MAELLVLHFEDGPFPGQQTTTELEWPLPDVVRAKGYDLGIYRKTFESKGKPKVKPNGEETFRGAKYTWDEDAELELSE